MRNALAVWADIAGCRASGDTARLAALMDELEVAVLLEPQLARAALFTIKELLGQDSFLRPGGYGSREGVFQFIMEASGAINHRQFVPW